MHFHLQQKSVMGGKIHSLTATTTKTTTTTIVSLTQHKDTGIRCVWRGRNGGTGGAVGRGGGKEYLGCEHLGGIIQI